MLFSGWKSGCCGKDIKGNPLSGRKSKCFTEAECHGKRQGMKRRETHKVVVLYVYFVWTQLEDNSPLISFLNDRKTYNMCRELYQALLKAFGILEGMRRVPIIEKTLKQVRTRITWPLSRWPWCNHLPVLYLGRISWSFSAGHGSHLHSEENISMYFAELILRLIKANPSKMLGMCLAHKYSTYFSYYFNLQVKLRVTCPSLQ